MRIFCGMIGVVACLLLVGLLPAAEEKSTSIWPKLKVGKVGNFMATKTKYWKVRIVELVSVDMMLVEVDKSDDPRFLVRGLPTKDLADDTIIELKGEWKVTGTGPYGKSKFNKKTYFVVEPLKKPTSTVKPKTTEKDGPKVVFKSDVALTAKAPTTWLLTEAKADAKFLANKDLTIAQLPKEMEGGALLVRDNDSQAGWIKPGMLTASKDVTVYVTVLWMWQGQPTMPNTTIAAFTKDDWTELKDAVDTTTPEGEAWKLKTFKRSLKKGTVNLQLRGVNWPRQMTFYVFK